MTDTFLDDHQTDTLTRQLRDLGDALPALEAATARTATRAVGSHARTAAHPASTPPIDVHALDLHTLVDNQAAGWTRCLLDDALIEPPADANTRRLCHHLATHADHIALQPWAPDIAAEIADTLRQVRAVTEPRETESITDRHHLAGNELHHRAHQAVGTAEDMAVVHKCITGNDLKPTTLYAWRNRGKLPKRTGPAGEAWFHYIEISQLTHQPNPQNRSSNK